MSLLWLTVPGESTMFWGSWKQGPRASPKHKAVRDNSHASDLLTSARMLIYLRSTTDWEPSVQYRRLWGMSLIKTTTIGLLVFSFMILLFSSSFLSSKNHIKGFDYLCSIPYQNNKISNKA